MSPPAFRILEIGLCWILQIVEAELHLALDAVVVRVQFRYNFLCQFKNVLGNLKVERQLRNLIHEIAGPLTTYIVWECQKTKNSSEQWRWARACCPVGAFPFLYIDYIIHLLLCPLLPSWPFQHGDKSALHSSYMPRLTIRCEPSFDKTQTVPTMRN